VAREGRAEARPLEHDALLRSVRAAPARGTRRRGAELGRRLRHLRRRRLRGAAGFFAGGRGPARGRGCRPKDGGEQDAAMSPRWSLADHGTGSMPRDGGMASGRAARGEPAAGAAPWRRTRLRVRGAARVRATDLGSKGETSPGTPRTRRTRTARTSALPDEVLSGARKRAERAGEPHLDGALAGRRRRGRPVADPRARRGRPPAPSASAGSRARRSPPSSTRDVPSGPSPSARTINFSPRRAAGRAADLNGTRGGARSRAAFGNSPAYFFGAEGASRCGPSHDGASRRCARPAVLERFRNPCGGFCAASSVDKSASWRGKLPDQPQDVRITRTSPRPPSAPLSAPALAEKPVVSRATTTS